MPEGSGQRFVNLAAKSQHVVMSSLSPTTCTALPDLPSSRPASIRQISLQTWRHTLESLPLSLLPEQLSETRSPTQHSWTGGPKLRMGRNLGSSATVWVECV